MGMCAFLHFKSLRDVGVSRFSGVTLHDDFGKTSIYRYDNAVIYFLCA